MPMSKVVGIIPARWGSTRFPGKPLHGIAGKPLIQHVWERCVEAGCFDLIVIATDDMRIADLNTYRPLGIYGYRRKALLDFVRMSPGALEQVEQLEQLRALENGLKIRVVVSEVNSVGVDTPEDATEVERLILSRRTG